MWTAPLLVLARFALRRQSSSEAAPPDLDDAARRLFAWTFVAPAALASVAARSEAMCRFMTSCEAAAFPVALTGPPGDVVRQKRKGITVVLENRHPNVVVAAFGRQALVCAPSFVAPLAPPGEIGRVFLGVPPGLLANV